MTLSLYTESEWDEYVATLNQMITPGSTATINELLRLHAEAMKKFPARRLARLYETMGLQETINGSERNREDGDQTEGTPSEDGPQQG